MIISKMKINHNVDTGKMVRREKIMRPKFLDIDKMTFKSFLLGSWIMVAMLQLLSELLKIGWNALNIIYIDFWVAELVVFTALVATAMIIVETLYRKDIKNINKK